VRINSRFKNRSQVNHMKLATNLCVIVIGIGIFAMILFRATTDASGGQTKTNADWSELISSMDKMHMAMGAVKPSGDSDVDFIRLMLPHHQAAIDMAKTQLLYGKDPQMRRLAQQIITDQQLEIELMQRWLKASESVRPKESDKPTTATEKNN
jgi:Domain of unknown function (DUF305)